MKAPLTLALAALAAAAAPAQVHAPHDLCTLYDRGDVAAPGPPLDVSVFERSRRSTTYNRVVSRGRATFVVDYSDGFTPQAQAAFQRAVDIWAAHLTSTVPVRVRADFEPLEPRVLGQAGPRLARDFGAGAPGTWYPFALADAIAGRDVFPDTPYDIEATFNSEQAAFDFGLNGAPPADKFDFVTIVLHELGHGLGFVGSGDVDDGAGDPECNGIAGVGCLGIGNAGGTTFPFIFDRFLQDGSGRQITDASTYPTPSRALGNLLQSQDLFVQAPRTVATYEGRPPVWAPTSFERGSSFSHWDENVVRGSSAALMTPRVGRGEAYQDPGDITCAFFLDMGWALGEGCATIVGVAVEPPPPPGPTVDALTVNRTGPNPARSATSVEVLLPSESDLQAVLYDALGRRVAVLFEGAGAFRQRLDVPAGRLASGVYVLRVQTPTEASALSLTVVR